MQSESQVPNLTGLPSLGVLDLGNSQSIYIKLDHDLGKRTAVSHVSCEAWHELPLSGHSKPAGYISVYSAKKFLYRTLYVLVSRLSSFFFHTESLLLPGEHASIVSHN